MRTRYGCYFRSCSWTRYSLGRPDWDEEMLAGHLRQSHPVGRYVVAFLAWRLRRSLGR